MGRSFQFAMFFIIFSSIYLLMHLYVFIRLGISWIYSFVSFGFIASNFLLQWRYNLLTRAVYILNAVWMGYVFLQMSVLFVYEAIRPFIRLPVIIIAVLLAIYSLFNSTLLVVKKIDANLGKKARFLMLSDIHVGTIHNHGTLKKIVDKCNSYDYDAVFIIGDIMAGAAPIRKGMFNELKNLKNACFVSGNHEFYEGKDIVEKMLSEVGVKVLKDEYIRIKGIDILGIDYGSDVLNVREGSIVLKHEPKNLGVYDKASLILCGHTHNGQIMPFNLFVRIFYKYVTGLHKIGHANIYISPGTGTWGPPMRLGSRNEVTLIEI